MENTVAHGVVEIEARTSGASAALRKIEGDFDRAMHNIDRQEAEVRLRANSAQFGKEVKKAKAELDELKAVRAEATIGANTKPLDRKIRQLEKDIAFIDRMKATVDIDVDTAAVKEAQSEIRTLASIEEKRAAAEEKYHKDRMRTLNEEARRRASLSDQRAREFRQDESAAHRMDALRTREAVNRDREQVQVLKLQREYAKLTDRLEALDKRHGFNREQRAKITLDTSEVYAKMELVKATLNRMGAHPPVDIRANIKTDRDTLRKKAFGGLGDILAKVAQGASNIPNATVRLGPFTSSVKGAVVALGFLGPSLVDVAGAATSLVGVLGTGLTGALTVVGGTALGLGMNLLGVKQALTPVIGDFKIATQSTLAYHKAVLQYGKGSDKAAEAQDKMNRVLRTMDPRAQAAAKAIGGLSTRWQTLTQGQANSSFIHVVGQYAKTMRELQPTLAGNTNRTMEILDERFTAILTHLRSAGAIKTFDSLGRSANNFLNPFLDGLQHVGAFLGRIAESAARLFAGPAGNAFKGWARDLDAANQSGQVLDDKIRHLGTHAKDLGSFFLSAGRLIKTVLFASSDAGDSMIKNMTKAMNRWNKGFEKDPGKLHDFFNRSADGATALFHVIGPLVAQFVKWSAQMAPWVTGLLKGVNAVGSLIGKIVGLTSLGGPVSTFAATLGAIWAVGKIGAFVAMLTRAASAIKAVTVAAAGARWNPIKMGSAANSAWQAREPIMQAGAQAGAAIAAEMRAAGTMVAAEIGGAMRTGGATAGAENLAGRVGGRTPGGVIIPPGAARAVEQEGAAAGRAAGALSKFKGAAGGAVTALTGLNPLMGVAVIGAVGLGYALYKLGQHTDHVAIASKAFVQAVGDYNTVVRTVGNTLTGAASANLTYGQSVHSVSESQHAANAAQREVNKLRDQGKTGTAAYKQAVLNARGATDQYKASLIDEYNAQQQLSKANRDAKRHIQGILDANGKRLESAQKIVDAAKHEATSTGALPEQYAKTSKAAKAWLDQQERAGSVVAPWVKKNIEAWVEADANLAAEQQRSKVGISQWMLATINAGRAAQGMVPIANSAARAMHDLITNVGRASAMKIAVKFPDPKEAARAAKGVNSAINAGVPKQKAVSAVLNAASAEAGIRRLNALKLQAKTLKIRTDEGDALAKVAALRGIRLPPKVLKMLHEGDPNVIAAIRKVLGIKLPAKTLIMLGNMADAVRKSGIVAAIKFATKVATFAGKNATGSAFASAIATGMSWASKVFKATFGAKHTKAQGGIVGAAGGSDSNNFMESGPTLQARQERALREAEKGRTSTRQTGKFNRPTLLVGEEHGMPEYVIATNPAYREANLDYLRAAAHDLGAEVIGAAGGKGAKAKTKKPPKKKGYKVPEVFRAGAVDEAIPQKSYDNAHSEWQDRHNAYESAKKSRASAKKRMTNKNSSHTTKAAAKKDYNKYDADAKRYHDGWKGHASLSALKKTMDNRKADLDAVKAVNKKIDLLNSEIEGERQMMDFAAHAPDHLAKDGKSFEDHRVKRQGFLDDLRGVLERAHKSAKDPNFAQGLQNQINSVDTELQALPGEAVDDPKEYTFDDLLRDYNMTDRIKNDIRDLALARANTPDDIADDQLFAGKLADDYKEVMDRAVREGRSADLITEAANDYISARDEVTGLRDATPEGVNYGGMAAVADSAKADVLRSFGSNAISANGGGIGGLAVSDPASGAGQWTQRNPAGLSVAPTSGGSGTIAGGGSSVTKVINQTNNFQQPPADVHTFSQGITFELGAAI